MMNHMQRPSETFQTACSTFTLSVQTAKKLHRVTPSAVLTCRSFNPFFKNIETFHQHSLIVKSCKAR
jgi:hypothetical protein